MRITRRAGAAAAVMAAAVAVASAQVPARAAAAPTASSVASHRAGLAVVLRVSGLSGTDPVTFFVKPTGEDRYAQAGVAWWGRGSTTFTTLQPGSFLWYAQQGRVRTAVRAVQSTLGSCRVSPGPVAVSSVPAYGPDSGAFDETTVSGSDGAGRLAGVSWNGVTTMFLFAVAGGRTTVLDRVVYPDGLPYSEYHSIRVRAVTPTEVVVSEQPPGTDLDTGERVGLVYVGTTRHVLRSSSSWDDVDPTGMAADGTIVGTFRNASGPLKGTYGVLTWAGPDAAPRFLADGLTAPPYPVIDSAGDVAYGSATTVLTVARGARGTTGRLAGSTDGALVEEGALVAGGTAFYAGQSGPYENGSTAVYDGRATGVVRPTRLLAGVQPVLDAAGSADVAGQLVLLTRFDEPKEFAFDSPRTGISTLPAVYGGGDGTPPPVLDGPGRVVFTDPSDRLPHEATCS